jgi:predicted component of type VI protein secretion system
VPEAESRRRADELDELSPHSMRKRRFRAEGGIARRLPGLRQLIRAREELAVISEFCDAAASAFGELVDKVEELERRIESLENR